MEFVLLLLAGFLSLAEGQSEWMDASDIILSYWNMQQNMNISQRLWIRTSIDKDTNQSKCGATAKSSSTKDPALLMTGLIAKNLK